MGFAGSYFFFGFVVSAYVSFGRVVRSFFGTNLPVPASLSTFAGAIVLPPRVVLPV